MLDMNEAAPVTGIRGTFRDDAHAIEAQDALNAWFRRLVDGETELQWDGFEEIDPDEYAWILSEDTDWEFVPHAKAVGRVVSIALETRETHRRLVGLLRRMGALDVVWATDDE